MSTEQHAGTDLVFAKSSLQERMAWARAISAAGDLVPAGLRNRDGSPNPAKILLAAETGAMLQIHPVAAINGIHVIEGKPSLSAGLMSGLVRRAGHKLRVTTKGDVSKGTYEATATLIRADDPTFEYKATWNAERAKRAGLLGKGSWSKYFEALCKARAISEVIREGAEDVLMGNAYTPEELGAVVNEHGEVIREDLIEDAELVEEAPEPTPAPRPARKPAQDDTREKAAVYQEWAERIADIWDLPGLIRLHGEAADRHVLDHTGTDGRSLEDVFVARREAIRGRENDAEKEPQLVPDYSSEYDGETPF